MAEEKEKEEVFEITQERKKELEDELEELSTIKRKEILEEIERAKSLGDLSENVEYQSAREEQAKLETRIERIKHILENSKIIRKKHYSVCGIGCTVTLKKEDGQEITYQIVGSEEADTTKGKLSNKSPLGLALSGKKKGDSAKIETPEGIIKYKVIEIK